MSGTGNIVQLGGTIHLKPEFIGYKVQKPKTKWERFKAWLIKLFTM